MEEQIDVTELPAEQNEPAPIQEETAAPEAEAQPEEKKFSQAELDEVLNKRLARERRKIEREVSARVAPQMAPVDPAQFQTTEAYVEALAESKAEQKAQQIIQRKEQEKVYGSFFEKEDEAAEQYPDYHAVTRSIPLTDETLAAAMSSENSTDVLYHLGKNPKEAARIASLPPYLQGMEVGKLSARLIAPPKPTQVSKAPAPVSPVGSQGQATKKPADMDDDEFFEHRRAYKMKRR